MSATFHSKAAPQQNFKFYSNTHTTPTQPNQPQEYSSKRSQYDTNKKHARMNSAYTGNEEPSAGENSFAIEGWNKKSRRPSEAFYGQFDDHNMDSQESLEGNYQQNIFKNDLANLSNGLFPTHKRDKQKTTRVVKQFPLTYSKPTTTRVYTNRPFTNQRLRADFDREIEMNRDSDIERIKLIDEGVTDVNLEEEEQKVQIIKISKEKEELKEVDSEKKLPQKKYITRPDLEKRDKSPDQVRQAVGGGFMGIGRPNPTITVSFQKREPQNLKLYLKVIQLLEKTKIVEDNKPITTEVNSVADLPTNSNPQLPVVTPTKGSRRENSSNRMKKSLTPTRTNLNVSMVSVNREPEESKRGKLERSYSVKKDTVIENGYMSQGSPQQDPKILFKPNLPTHTPKYPPIDPSSGRTTPILTTTRPLTATACHKLYTHHPKKKSPSPSPNNPKKIQNQTQTSFSSLARQDTIVQRNNSAVYEGENDSMIKPYDTSSNKQMQTVVPSHEVSFKMNENDGFLPYYQQEKSFDMDVDLHPSLKTHFRSTSVTNRGWRPKDGRPETKQQTKGIKIQVYHLPLPMPDPGSGQEDTKRKTSIRKLRRRDTTEMSVEDFFKRDEEQEKKPVTTKRSQAPSPSPERDNLNGFTRVRKLLYSHTKKTAQHVVTDDAMRNSSESITITRLNSVAAEQKQKVQRYRTLEKLLGEGFAETNSIGMAPRS